MAWLSWYKLKVRIRSRSFSHSVNADRLLVRRPWSQDASSASTVLWLTAVCFLDWPLSGKNVCGSKRTNNVLDVDRVSLRSPAKSASAKRPRFSSVGSSPTHPSCLQPLVVLTYLMIRRSFLSQSESRFVIYVVIAPTTLSNSKTSEPSHAHDLHEALCRHEREFTLMHPLLKAAPVL